MELPGTGWSHQGQLQRRQKVALPCRLQTIQRLLQCCDLSSGVQRHAGAAAAAGNQDHLPPLRRGGWQVAEAAAQAGL